jgi:hypothetical protein
MSVPSLTIDRSGAFMAVDSAARELMKTEPGTYRLLAAGGLFLLIPDAGTGAGPREDEYVAFAGDVRAMPLLGLLNLLGQNRETGRLVVKRDDTERVIMLRDGDIASVGSNSPDDRLGQFLLRLGKVTEQELTVAVDEVKRTGGRLGQVLVQKGFLQAHELWSTIQSQITDIFTDVVQWEDGLFVLYRSKDGYRFPSTPALSMQGLLLEAVRRADEMKQYREKIPESTAVIRKTGRELDFDDADDLQKRAYQSMMGETKISDLGTLLHTSEFDATRTAYALLKKKVVEIVEQEPVVVGSVFALGEAEAAKLEVYNLAFREIRDEIVRHGKLEKFMTGVMRFLSDGSSAHAGVLNGVVPDQSGAMPGDKLVSNVSRVRTGDPWQAIQDAMNELTFFMLFQCGEFLDPQSDENLGRRVRLIHSALAGSSVI